ncbi:hypothetical protein R6Q59_013747 [Mikania micrantha]
MASINLQSEDDGGDGYSSPERSEGVSSSLIKIVSGESGELCPSVVSVTSAEPSSLSCSIREKIMNASTDWYPSETASCSDDSGTGCQHEGSDGDGDGGGGDAVKKPVWSKPSSTTVEVVGPIMGAAYWPAVGESTKAAYKSSSSESLQTLSSEPLLPALLVIGNSSSSSHKPESENLVSTPNHVTNSGQSSMRHAGRVSDVYSSPNRGVSQRSPKSQESKAELSPPSSSGKPATVLSSYPKDHTYNQSPRGGIGSQPNGGMPTRSGGSYRPSYGGKLNQGRGRGNQQWNQHRNFNRDTNMQPHRGGYHRSGYIRPSVHKSIPFNYPQMLLPVPPFGNNALYPGSAPPMVRGPLYYPVQDHLHVKIRNQIDYYFSNDNLVKDTYLRQHMDKQGWVPVNLIAGFNKVSSLTDNVMLILDVMQKSTVVEVQGDKMRRQNDWMRWLMPAAAQVSLQSQDERVFSKSSSAEF